MAANKKKPAAAAGAEGIGRARRMAQRDAIFALTDGLPPEHLHHVHSALGNLLDCESIADNPVAFIRANTPPGNPQASGHNRFQAQRVLESEYQLLGMAKQQAGRAYTVLDSAGVHADVLDALRLLMEQTFLVTQATLEQLAADCGLVMPMSGGE